MHNWNANSKEHVKPVVSVILATRGRPQIETRSLLETVAIGRIVFEMPNSAQTDSQWG